MAVGNIGASVRSAPVLHSETVSPVFRDRPIVGPPKTAFIDDVVEVRRRPFKVAAAQAPRARRSA